MNDQQLHDTALAMADVSWHKHYPLVSSMESEETFKLWVTQFYLPSVKNLLYKIAGYVGD